MPRRLALLVVLACALPAAALAQGVFEPVRANVDDDAARERLVPELLRDRNGYETRRAVLRDPGCRSWILTRAHDVMARLEARELDGRTARREILAEGRSGAAGRAGMTRIVRYDRRSGAEPGCGAPRYLFSYSTSSPKPPAPRGWYVANYGVRVRRGRLSVSESLARNDQPPIAARRERTTRWRYSRARDRFVVAR